MIHVAALYDHLASRVSCRMSEQTRNRLSCAEQRRHATHWWRKKKATDFSFFCSVTLIIVLQFWGALFLVSSAPPVMLKALDPLAARCVHASGTVRADEQRRRSVGLCIVLSWEDRQKSEWINFITSPFKRQQKKKISVSHNFLTPERERDWSNKCRRRYRGGQIEFLIKENNLSWQ